MPETFSVIFAGTPEFAVPSLEALVSDPAFDVTLVISQPDRPVGRKQLVAPPPVKTCAKKHGIRILQHENINKELIGESISCDFLVVVAYGQIISKEVLEIPKIAPVNVHASLLPRWRGASPIQNALLAGDEETGITIQKISEAVDTGDILAQCATPIDDQETLQSLHNRLATLGSQLLTETLKNPLSPTPQDEAGSTHCAKLTRSDGDVNPQKMTAVEIDRHVRALVPWPGVRCDIYGTSVKLMETSLMQDSDAFALPCADDSTLYIRTLQPPGKKPMSGASWKLGHQE